MVIDNNQQTVKVDHLDEGTFAITVGDETITVDARRIGPNEYHLLHKNRSYDVVVADKKPQLIVYCSGGATPVQLLDERQSARLLLGGFEPRQKTEPLFAIRAPMPGKVIKSLVRKGERVFAGQGVMVMEAMKMENELRSMVAGIVKDIPVAEGKSVEAGEDLVLIE